MYFLFLYVSQYDAIGGDAAHLQRLYSHHPVAYSDALRSPPFTLRHVLGSHSQDVLQCGGARDDTTMFFHAHALSVDRRLETPSGALLLQGLLRTSCQNSLS